MAVLMPIDAHAHVDTAADAAALRGLRSVLFAVTNDPRDWDAALARRDELCVWGIGCHPGEPAALAAFDQDRLAAAAEHTPVIGEVGLDGASKAPLGEQRRVFAAVLEVARERSRIVTIHSVRATGAVIQELDAAGGVPGAVLHWWRGSPAETRRAVELGCYFSLNGHEALRPKVLAALPPERVLTETDYPHSRHYDPAAVRPGAVSAIESALGEAWGLAADAVRRQLWTNLAELCAQTRTSSMMPRRVQGGLLVVR